MSRRTLASVISVLLVAGLLVHLLAIRKTTAGRWMDDGADPVPPPQTTEVAEGPGPRNSTLGFHKIFYLSMPERTDRRDMMTLIAGYLGLDFVVMDAVNGSLIADKAMPYDVRHPPAPGPDKEFPLHPAVGCWRAHANLWSHIISSGISSALILEDDADFSVGIRDIMEGISLQLQDVIGAKDGEPYGLVNSNSWDMLSLGNCGYRLPDSRKNPKATQKIRYWVDPYSTERKDFLKHVPNIGSSHLRMLAPSKGNGCTHGYAVTREGAMRLLYNVGGPGHILDEPVDLLMMRQAEQGLYKAFVVAPSVVGQWKYGDWRDTDIQRQKEGGSSRHWGSGPDIIRSVRKEIMEVLGNRNVWEEFESQEE